LRALPLDILRTAFIFERILIVAGTQTGVYSHFNLPKALTQNMEKLNTFLEKNVGKIAIGLGVMGIIAQVLISLSVRSKIVAILNAVYFRDPFTKTLSRFDISSDINFLSILFLSMLITGGFHYEKTKGKDSRLLKFGFSIIALTKLLSIIFIPVNYLYFKKFVVQASNFRGEIPSLFDFTYHLFFTIPLLYVSYHLLKWLIRQQDTESIEVVSVNEDLEPPDQLASKSKRFTHFIFDTFIMFSVLWYVINTTVETTWWLFFSSNPPGWISRNFPLNLSIGAMALIYYLVFEGLFNATPVKFLTGTRVVHAKDMQSPGFGKVFVRTLCRRIPFDVLSFFGKKGWHDSISGTKVIHEKRKGELEFKHTIWIWLLFGVYIAMTAYSLAINKIDEYARDDFHETTAQYQKEAILDNLNAGDLLIFRSKNGGYKDDQLIVIVEQVSDKEVSGTQYHIGYKNKTDRSGFLSQGIDANWAPGGQVSIGKEELISAFFNSSARQAIEVDQTAYILEHIEDIDNPKFSNRSSSGESDNGVWTTSFFVNFDAVSMAILSIETIEGDTEWTSPTSINTSFNPGSSAGHFQLSCKDQENKSSKSRMKILYNGNKHSYIVYKYNYSIKFAKEVIEK